MALTPAQASTRIAGGASLRVEGLTQLQKALRRTEGDLPRLVTDRLDDIGQTVRGRAKANVPAGGSGVLRASIAKSRTLRAVTVYSNVVYARVQDQGGRVGRNHATILGRGNVSQYMTRAVRDSGGEIERRLEQLLTNIVNDLGR